MSRLERLRGRLEEPLLVTSPVSVRYLTGFVSSNAVCLEAQAAGLAAVRAGAAGQAVDAAARALVDATEFAGLFGHGLPEVLTEFTKEPVTVG